MMLDYINKDRAHPGQASCPSFNGLLITGIDYKKSTMVIENQTIVLDIW